MRFRAPPMEARPMLRWWWFGGAVTEEELSWELEEMQRQGFGGVEIQPVYPLALDDPEKRVRNLPYLSDEFCERLRFAVRKARELGMRADVTLGSGWPYGGPHIRPDERAKKLSRREIAVTGPEVFEGPVSEDGAGADRVIAVFAVPSESASPSAAGLEAASRFVDLSGHLSEERVLRWDVPDGDWTIQAFIESDTGQQVKRPTVGAEGYVLNHYSRPALEQHLETVGERLLETVSDESGPLIGNFFCDSWEVYGSNWTPGFLETFEERRGYDLKPLLPLLWDEGSPEAGAVQYDYRKTLSELALERFFRPLAEWCEEHGVGARIQAHGTPADTFLAYAAADVPEGESYGPEADTWRPDIAHRRTASSAAHLFGKPVCSAESYTWLRRPRYQTTLEQMKAASDVFFLDGINQVVGHGFPYSPREIGSPGWNFYAATMINPNNTWWPHVRHLTDYVARVSYLLQQGENVADVLIYLPSGDTWSKPFERHMNSSREWAEQIDDEIFRGIFEGGCVFDVVDDEVLTGGMEVRDGRLVRGRQEYRFVILPDVSRIPPQTLTRLIEFAETSGNVIAWKSVPREACSYRNRSEDSRKVRELSDRLFGDGGPSSAKVVSDGDELAGIIRGLWPDVRMDHPAASVGFVHRRTGETDVYFLANVGPDPVESGCYFRAAGVPVSWGVETGEELPAGDWDETRSGTRLVVHWEPFESKIVVFRPAEQVPEPLRVRTNVADPRIVESESQVTVEGIARDPGEYWAALGEQRAEVSIDRSPREINVDGPWRLTAEPLTGPVEVSPIGSWTDIPEMKYFSGTATYTTEFTVPDTLDLGAYRVELDLGEVREVAEVWVNGKHAGVSWHQPHRLDVTELVKPGKNTLRVDVTNLLINRVLGSPDPDYSALEQKHGRRFPPPGEKEQVEGPLPSGLIGPVRITGTPRVLIRIRDTDGG